MPAAAHVAGIGIASISRNETIDDLAIAASTKALLDAGVTYSSVDQSIACFLDERERIGRRRFSVFGMEGAPVCEVDNSAGFFTAVQYIRSGQSNCVLVVGLDREASTGSRKTQALAAALLLVSSSFLMSHAYLKDSAIRIRACNLTSQFHSRSVNSANDTRTAKTAIDSALRQAKLQPKDLQIVEVKQGASQPHLREALRGLEVSQPQDLWSSSEAIASTTGWSGMCRLVYQLRGWATDVSTPKAQNCLQYTKSEDGTASVLILTRSDGQPAPAWNDIKNVRDGRERLGYNPAVEVRAITQEDLEAVRAMAEFTSDSDLLRLRLPIKGGDRAALARL